MSSISPASPDRPPKTSSRSIKHLPELKANLQRVATARGRFYVQKMAILVYFAKDDTNAEDDVRTFDRLMTDMFDIKTMIWRIEHDHITPGLTLLRKINELLTNNESDGHHRLFIFYYAGHAFNQDGKLQLSTCGKMINWSTIHEALFEDGSSLANIERVDVLAVLDCCFSGMAGRAESTRSTQVLAAANQIGVARRLNQMSFTQRIHRAVYALKSSGPTMTVAALFQEIKRVPVKNAPDPVLNTISGTHPITLAFQSRLSPSPIAGSPSRIPIHTSPPTKDEHVLVKLTMHGNPDDTFKAFQEAIKNLPVNMQVEVTDAYETDQSFFCLLNMTWEAWGLWTMVADLEIVGKTYGHSLVHNRGQVETMSVQKENIPFHGVEWGSQNKEAY